jgi:hypothetical protein
MKKILLGCILVITWYESISDVIMTGIMDGTLTGGKPKAVELFIAGTEDLGGYEIWRSRNGDPFGSGSGSIVSLNGIYNNTFVYLVKSDHVAEFHSVFGDTGFYANVIPLAIVSGNGNEGFQIRDTVGDVVIDQVWLEDPTDSYRDSYWYRINGTGPDGTWLATNWESPGNDALDNLNEAGLRASVPFGTYSLIWKGISHAWEDASNWMPGIIPSNNCNVHISDTVPFSPVIYNDPSSPARCFNLTVAENASVTVAAGKALTVGGNLLMYGDQTSDRFLLNSDSSLTATGSFILKGETEDSIKVQRFILADNSWHFLSTPLAGQYIQPEFASEPVDNTFDLYCWQEAMPLSEGWMNIRDVNGNLNPQFDTVFVTGKGYLVAYSNQYTGNILKSFRGIPNYGNMELPVLHSCNYWNLMGNPYTCAIDWSSAGIDKTNLAGGAMYIWDQLLNSGAGGYRTHNGEYGIPANTTGIIPAMNGFFVHSLDSGSIVFDVLNHSTLIHGVQDYYRKKSAPFVEHIRLAISNNDFSDETLILFNPLTTNNYDPLADALKLPNGVDSAPEISSITEVNRRLCINQLGSYPVSVPLHIEHGYTDTLVLTAFDYEGLNAAVGVLLEDVSLGVWHNLREEPAYTFCNEAPGDPQRLVLHFITPSNVVDTQPQNEILAYTSGDRIFVKGLKSCPTKYFITDIRGRIVASGELEESINIKNIPHGVYILCLWGPGHGYRQKIIL